MSDDWGGMRDDILDAMGVMFRNGWRGALETAGEPLNYEDEMQAQWLELETVWKVQADLLIKRMGG